MNPIYITHGLGSSDRSCKAIAVANVCDYIAAHKDCYERTLPATGANETDTANRVYIDIDGKIPAAELPVDEFDALMDDMLAQLEEAMSVWDTAVMTSHGANYTTEHHKVSFRFHFKGLAGSRAAIKAFAMEKVAPRVAEYIGGMPYGELVSVDDSVYSANRKMRMCGSSKDKENRPLRLVRGDVMDTIITYIPDGCEMLPEPAAPPPKAPKPKPAAGGAGAPTPPPEIDADDIRVKVLSAIAPARYDNYADWLAIGAICYNEGLGCDTWDTLSRVSPKWAEGGCAGKWHTFKADRDRRITIATAWKWLKTDNPTEYARLGLERTDFWKLVRESSHADCAAFFYSIKPNAYAFHPALGWYDLQPTNIWRNSEGKDLPVAMKRDIYLTFREVINEHNAQCDLGTETGREQNKKLVAFARETGNANFVRGITEFLIASYYDNDLPKKMGENPHLFAFKNCVFDTRTGTTRPIVPEDYICHNTGYDLPPREDCVAAINELRTVLWSFWEDDATLKWWAWTVANTLYGRNNHNRFYIWTGRGGNGKSMLLKLIKQCYGDYYHTFSASVLTGKSDKKDAPLPALAQSKGKRFAAATEPDDASGKFQAATVKSFTGNEEVRAREMYKTDITFTPQFTLFVACNDVPTYTKIDGGVIRRQRVLRFPFDFTQAEQTEPHHRPGNKAIDARFESDKTLAAALAWMLMDAYKAPAPPEPTSVKKATEDENDNNLPVKQWLLDNYTLHCDPDDETTHIRSTELLAEYNAQAESRMTAATFKSQCDAAGVEYKRKGDGRFFLGLRKKPDTIVLVPGGEDGGYGGYGGAC